MTDQIFRDIRRRHLIVIATGKYDNERWPDLDVETEVKVWRDWLTDDDLEDRQFTQIADELERNPTGSAISSFFLDSARAAIAPSDAVVVVVTGHGEVRNGEHRMVLKCGDPGQPTFTMQRTSDIIAWLHETGVQHALVLIDACHAGQVSESVVRFENPLPPGWFGMATTAPTGVARLGAVADAVTAFLEVLHPDGPYGSELEEYLKPREFHWVIDDALRQVEQGLYLFAAFPSDGQSPCLPNPRYRRDQPDVVETADVRRALAIRTQDLAAHWDPRSRGVQHADEPGWWFTGRQRLMRALLATVRGGPGVVVVTGTAGCGKSAVLSRLVTLSDPQFRIDHSDLVAAIPEALRPLAGDVDVALLATGLTSVELLDQLSTALDIQSRPIMTGAGLHDETMVRQDALRERLAVGPPVTIVLDALDEAADPWAVLRDFLSPLAESWENPPLRLVIGVRSAEDDIDPARTLAGATLRDLHGRALRADSDPYWKRADLRGFIANRLMVSPADSSPYKNRRKSAEKLARVLAKLAGKSYVVAQVVARDLANRETIQDPADPEWRATVRRGLASVFQAELNHTFRQHSDRERAFTVLRAAAFAFGRGVPWRQIWPRIATALANHGDYGDRDIDEILRHRIGGYLIRNLEDDITVYRPFHDALARALISGEFDEHRMDDVAPGGVADSQLPASTEPRSFTMPWVVDLHGRILDALRPLLRPRDLLSGADFFPDPYVRKHLAQHAAAAGRLDELLGDAVFLVHAGPAQLLRVLKESRTSMGRAAADVYRKVAPQLTSHNPMMRASILELGARQYRREELAKQIANSFPHRPWRTRWAREGITSAHQLILHGHRGAVMSVALSTLLDGRPVVVSAGTDGMLRVWELDGGQPVGGPINSFDVDLVVAAELPNGHSVVVCGGLDEMVRIWDVDSGRIIAQFDSGHPAGVTSLAVGTLSNGHSVIVSGGGIDGILRIWELDGGRPVGNLHTGHDDGVYTVAVGTLPDGRPVIVSGGGDGLRVWELDSGRPVGDLLDGHVDGVHTVTVGTLPDGRPVIVSDGGDGLRIWALDGGQQIGDPIAGHSGGPSAVAAGTLHDHRPVIVSSGFDETVRVWELDGGRPIGEPLTGHDSAVQAVAMGTLPNGGPVIVSGSLDETVRIWELEDGPRALGEQAAGPTSGIQSITTGTLPSGRPVIVSGGTDGAIRTWDLDSGLAIAHFESASAGWMAQVAVGTLPGGSPVVVSGSTDGILRIWELDGGQPIGEIMTGEAGGVALTVGKLSDGRAVIVTGGANGMLRIWELDGGRPIGKPLTAHVDGVTALAVGTLRDGRQVVVSGGAVDATGGKSSGSVRIWDLDRGQPIGDPLVVPSGHMTSVAIGTLQSEKSIIVTGGFDGLVRTWDLDSGEPIGEPIAGHDGAVSSVAAGTMPDGRLVIVSGGWDRTVRIWDMRTHAALVDPLRVGTIRDVCSFPGGWAVATKKGLIVGEFA